MSTKLKQNYTRVFLSWVLIALSFSGYAQDSTVTETDTTIVEDTAETGTVKKVKPVKNTFESIWIIDNQTVMVPAKKSFEMDILHRFGTLENGYEDFYGFFAPSNIKLSFAYVPINKLLAGASITKTNMTWEIFAKYALFTQTKGKYPVSISFYSNAAVDTRDKDNFINTSDRWMFFNQLLIARKFSDKLSIQVAPSVSHINVVNGYYKTSGTPGDSSYKSEVEGEMKHNHFAIAFSARYKLKPSMAILFNYDQPITIHPTNNPNPNISIGVEFSTSSHAFQLFFTNYYYMTPQRNNFFNQNDPGSVKSLTLHRENFLLGFNITRLWNY